MLCHERYGPKLHAHSTTTWVDLSPSTRTMRLPTLTLRPPTSYGVRGCLRQQGMPPRQRSMRPQGHEDAAYVAVDADRSTPRKTVFCYKNPVASYEDFAIFTRFWAGSAHYISLRLRGCADGRARTARTSHPHSEPAIHATHTCTSPRMRDSLSHGCLRQSMQP